MRRSIASLLCGPILLAALMASPTLARADDPVPPGSETPRFAGTDIALAAACLPEGWTFAPVTEQSADEKAIREQVATLAVPLEEKPKVSASPPLLTADGKAVSVVLVDLDKEPAPFAAALKAVAAEKGWGYRELGTPARLVLVAGPEAARAAALQAQAASAVNAVAAKAANAMKGFENGHPQAAVEAYVLSRSVLAIDAKHAPSHFLVANMIVNMAARGNPQAKVDDAVAHFRAAIAKDATHPLTGADAVSAVGRLGEGLLSLSKDAEGRDLLKQAVAQAAGTKVDREEVLRFRYNLACAHGRLKEKDEAFALLGPLLDDVAKDPVPQLGEIWRTDPDFASLKDDPRWAALMAKHQRGLDDGMR